MKNSKLKILTASLCLLATSTYATSDKVMLDMIDFIEQRSKYHYSGEKLPYIQIRTRDELCKSIYSPDVYENIKDSCSVVGYYDHNLNTIFIADQPGEHMVEEGFIETVLFHELVHFLQFVTGEYDRVECQNALEADAYLLHNNYVEHMGYPEQQKPDPLFAMIVSMCPRDHHHYDIP